MSIEYTQNDQASKFIKRSIQRHFENPDHVQFLLETGFYERFEEYFEYQDYWYDVKDQFGSDLTDSIIGFMEGCYVSLKSQGDLEVITESENFKEISKILSNSSGFDQQTCHRALKNCMMHVIHCSDIFKSRKLRRLVDASHEIDVSDEAETDFTNIFGGLIESCFEYCGYHYHEKIEVFMYNYAFYIILNPRLIEFWNDIELWESTERN